MAPKGSICKETKRGGGQGNIVPLCYRHGAYAESYYNPELLLDAACTAIPPDIRAAWRMGVILADGKATSENVMILKQALGIFPAFHEEIRSILTGLSRE